MTALSEKELPKLQRRLDHERQECKLAIEAVSDVISEMVSLLALNFAETSIDPEIGYNPNWGQYLSYELTDSIKVVTARYNGVLVGYAVYLIGAFKHNQDVEYADLDVIWIDEAFREGWVAIKMMRMGEEAVSHRAKFITATSTLKKPIDVLLRRVGFSPVEVLYHKPLGNTDGKPESTSGPA